MGGMGGGEREVEIGLQCTVRHHSVLGLLAPALGHLPIKVSTSEEQNGLKEQRFSRGGGGSYLRGEGEDVVEALREAREPPEPVGGGGVRGEAEVAQAQAQGPAPAPEARPKGHGQVPQRPHRRRRRGPAAPRPGPAAPARTVESRVLRKGLENSARLAHEGKGSVRVRTSLGPSRGG